MKHPFVIFFVGAKSITQVVSSFLVKYEKKMITKIYSVIILLFI